jgi:hypothetical protein
VTYYILLIDMLHGNALHGNVLHGNALHGNVLHGNALHGNVLHGNVLHGNVLHGNVLHGNVSHKNDFYIRYTKMAETRDSRIALGISDIALVGDFALFAKKVNSCDLIFLPLVLKHIIGIKSFIHPDNFNIFHTMLVNAYDARVNVLIHDSKVQKRDLVRYVKYKNMMIQYALTMIDMYLMLYHAGINGMYVLSMVTKKYVLHEQMKTWKVKVRFNQSNYHTVMRLLY